jgi:hypothetical protein
MEYVYRTLNRCDERLAFEGGETSSNQGLAALKTE